MRTIKNYIYNASWWINVNIHWNIIATGMSHVTNDIMLVFCSILCCCRWVVTCTCDLFVPFLFFEGCLCAILAHFPFLFLSMQWQDAEMYNENDSNTANDNNTANDCVWNYFFYVHFVIMDIKSWLLWCCSCYDTLKYLLLYGVACNKFTLFYYSV